MKKILKNNKAGVPIIVGIILVAIIAIGIGYFFYSGTSTPYWETENEFGMWQDEIIVEYADGTTRSLKMIESQPQLKVFYGTEEITSISLKLSAKATGEGYTGAEVKTTGFGYNGRIVRATHPIPPKHEWTATRGDSTTQVTLGQTKTLINSGVNLNAEINDNPVKYPNGAYFVDFFPKGTVQYRGYPDGGDWESATLPPNRHVTIAVVHTTPPGSILVTLSSEVITG